MRHGIAGLLAGVGLAVGGAVALAPPALAALTPEGPATVSSAWRGPSTDEGLPPKVLQAVRVTVGPGGRAGLVRVRASDAAVDPGRGVVLGEWVTLPAEPGTYAIPAPRIDIDYRSVTLALDQQTGGHAIVEELPCTPDLGRWADVCQLVSLDAWTPILADGVPAVPPERRRGEQPPEPAERRAGQRLRFELVSEVDDDRDLAGDQTEDRTDLAVQAEAVRGRDGRLTITVTNRGPRTADRPLLTVDRPRAQASEWTPACAASPPRFMPPVIGDVGLCALPALPAGQSHTVALPTIDDGRPLVVSAAAEGPDLAADDNTVSVVVRPAAAPAATLRAPRRARAARGVRVRVRSDQAGTASVTLTVRFRGATRRATRTVALRAGAARSVRLRPARVRGGAFPTGRGRLTVSVTAPDSETRTLQRSVLLVP